MREERVRDERDDESERRRRSERNTSSTGFVRGGSSRAAFVTNVSRRVAPRVRLGTHDQSSFSTSASFVFFFHSVCSPSSNVLFASASAAMRAPHPSGAVLTLRFSVLC